MLPQLHSKFRNSGLQRLRLFLNKNNGTKLLNMIQNALIDCYRLKCIFNALHILIAHIQLFSMCNEIRKPSIWKKGVQSRYSIIIL